MLIYVATEGTHLGIGADTILYETFGVRKVSKMVNGPRKHGTDDFCETSSLTVKIIPTNVLANLFKDIDLTKTYFRIFAKI